jgi:hypothetical protein
MPTHHGLYRKQPPEGQQRSPEDTGVFRHGIRSVFVAPEPAVKGQGFRLTGRGSALTFQTVQRTSRFNRRGASLLSRARRFHTRPGG